MKKLLLSAAVFLLFTDHYKACADYYPDGDYFNLFTQSIIKDKSYIPFLLSYSNQFYDHEHYEIPDENIEAWQKFFGNKLTYPETKNLVYTMSMNDLKAFKQGSSANPILKKLGSYQNYQEAIDYLIEAKYLEPYMRVKYIDSDNSFYYGNEESSTKNATNLDYDKTIAALTSLYNTTKNPEIKLRYGYQLVRFNHYTRNYSAAIQAFSKYVEPLKTKSVPYYWAVDQMAGAQRGLNQGSDANWNFFKVFINSKSRRADAYVSMKLSDTASFKNIMDMAQTKDEKNMAYFLLGYEDFNDPIPVMEKMYDIDPNSEILKVMAARAINQLERSYLPTYYYKNNDESKENTKTENQNSDSNNQKAAEQKVGFWDKIVIFFKNLFSSKSEKPGDGNKNSQSDDELLKNPDRIPVYTRNYYGNSNSEDNDKNFLNNFEKFVEKTKEKSNDEYWQIVDAYLKFLQKKYEDSNEILAQIKTQNPEYLDQINRMKMLNEIVSQPRITDEFEVKLMQKYASSFSNEPKKDTVDIDDYYTQPKTSQFLRDVLANRYFLQGDDGKSFLMNNKLSDLQYSPDSKIVKSIEEFYKKPNKNALEQQIAKNLDVANPEAFFNLIYGDKEMRNANFEGAVKYYEKVKNFAGIPRTEYDYSGDKMIQKPHQYGDSYNGFNNLSGLVFGHNVWESYQSDENESMKAEPGTTDFTFIKPLMNKLELAKAAVQLKQIGTQKDEKAARANQLLGNLLYNTSILGYYRELFVMDIDNSNGGKYYFMDPKEQPYNYYYKDFTYRNFIAQDNFDLAINYYQKALNLATNDEQKARILFQMASAEQGKFYQYDAAQDFTVDYSDPNYQKNIEANNLKLSKIQNQKYKTYFTQLKTKFAGTKTANDLMGSCTYFDYFMKKQN